MGVQNGTATWEGSLAISYKITHTLTLCRSVTKSCPTPHDPTDCSKPGPLSSTLSQSLLKFMSTESVMLSNQLILCLLLLLLLSIFSQHQGLFPLTTWASSYSPWYLPKETESLCAHKNLHTSVHSSFK